MPLFVDDIDKDLVSDIGTRIIFEDLVSFTHEQMQKHPEIGPGEDAQIDWIWHQTTKIWKPKTFTLPYVTHPGGIHKPLLLVPHRAVYGSLRMSARKYWSKTILDEVQSREAVVINGKLTKSPKEDLASRQDLRAVRPTSRTWTERVLREDDRDLTGVYERYVDGKSQPMSYDEVLRRVRNP